MTKKIYLAGPDVFRADHITHGERLKKLCADAGFVGLYPLDNELENPTAGAIFCGNFRMIFECDIVIANITPFRGPGMDSGTAWEIGCAYGMNKQVVLYSDSLSDYAQRVHSYGIYDKRFPFIEDFGLPENLMICCSGGTVFPSFKDALSSILNKNQSKT